jgi:hypothetical protein
MNDKVKFMWKGAIWIAIIATLVLAACGLIWGAVIEGSLLAEIAKYFVMDLVIIAILWTFWYTLGQVAWHWMDDYKEKYGKGWFWKGIKDDLKYIKENTTWKKVGKVVLAYVIFFGVFGLLIWLLP